MDFGTIQTLQRLEVTTGRGFKATTKSYGYRIVTNKCDIRIEFPENKCDNCECIPDPADISQFYGRQIHDICINDGDNRVRSINELSEYSNVHQIEFITGRGRLRFSFKTDNCTADCHGIVTSLIPDN